MRKFFLVGAFIATCTWLMWSADASKELDAAAGVVQNISSSHQIPSSLLSQALPSSPR
jgi:hypothetical protein